MVPGRGVDEPRSGPEPGTDREVLRGAAYVDSANLDDRRNIYEFRAPRFDLVDSVLDQLAVPAAGRVLDVGCGPGAYLARLAGRDPALRVTGMDLSPGMLRTTRRQGVTCVAAADATALPFAAGTFHAVMANHMLYHVAEIRDAVQELRRVLRSGGTLLAVTNGQRHFEEFDELLARVSGRAGWWRPSHRFTLENGRCHVDAVFDSVELVRFEGELRVPDAAPVLRFARSMRDLSGHELDDGAWNDLMQRFATAVGDVIASDGAFRTRTDTGVFVCR